MYQDQPFYFVPVEEALLIKALLGRGPDVGKNDIEDIKDFLKIYPDVNYAYLTERQLELGLSTDFWNSSLK